MRSPYFLKIIQIHLSSKFLRHHSILTPISHPGCIKNPLVLETASVACVEDVNDTRNDLALGFGVEWDEGMDEVGGTEETLLNPGYLHVRVSGDQLRREMSRVASRLTVRTMHS